MLDSYTVTFIGHRYIDRFSFVEDKVEELVRSLRRQHYKIRTIISIIGFL